MSASSSRFTVTCPGCGERLRFELPLDGPARVRVQCAACRTQFGVRRPGVAPISSSPAAGAAGAAGAPAAGGSSAAGETAPLIGTPTASPVGVTAARPPVFAAGELVAARYRVVRFLAQGGMGEVYEVEDLELREAVALKTVRPEAAADSMAVERFRREIQLARKVTHPNVCRIFDVYYHRPAGGGGPAVIFLTMELLVGETLATRLRGDGPLPAGEVLAIARQICLGLDAAHQVGVIHRDLKPGNIVLVPGRGGWRAVVTDFGLARLDGGNDPAAPTLTVAGGLVGTPAYLAPEQVEGGEITTAVDVYALGIVLYEMATGTVPFVGDSVLATAVKRLKELPVSPRVHAPHLDPRWEAAILRCLARDPADRFASALDVLAALTAPEAGAAAALPAAGVAPAPGPAGSSPSLPGGAAATAASMGMGNTGAAGATAVTAATGTSAVTWADPAVPAMAAAATAAANVGDAAVPPSVADGAAVASAAGGAAAAERRRSGRRLAALAALVLVALAVGWYRYTTWRRAKAAAEAGIAPGGEVTPRRSVAVLGFRDLSGAAGTAWLSPAFAEMLTTELGAGGGLRVIGGEEVARAKLELQLGQPDSLARDTLGRIRTLLGSDAVVLGSYLVVGAGSAAQVRLDVRMQDALTGETATFAETGPQADLLKLVSHAGDRLRDQLHAAGAAAPVHAAAVANPEAARLYAEGMQKLRLFDPVGARDLLVQAVAADPASALAHSGLAAAWATLGFDDKAVAEAKTAFELSSGLPAEDRLVIEGRYREATGELGTAVDIYRRLLSLTPDNLDYGLRLAGAQTAAGQPQAALLTTGTLRTLPAPMRDDPRIDLAEATAAGAHSDFARQHAAAANAARRAAALGATLLVAQARLLDCLALRSLGRADEALAACAEGRRLDAAAGDRAGVAEALTGAANVHFDRGDLPAALALYQQALATDREIGRRGAEAGALNNIAVVLRSQGDLDRARQLFEQVLVIARELGSRRAEANSQNNLAGVLLRRGDLEAAAALYQQSLALWRSLGDGAGEAYALDNLGVALRRRGDLPAALARCQEALAIRRRTGQKTGEAASLNHLGSIHFDQGDLDAAGRDFQQALTASRAIASQTATAAALYGLAEISARQARWDDARRDHQSALDLRTALGEKGTVAESRLALAELAFAAARAAQPPGPPAAAPAGAGAPAAQAPATATFATIANQAEALADDLAHQGANAEQSQALSLAALAATAAGDPHRAAADIGRATALLQPPPAAPPPAPATPATATTAAPASATAATIAAAPAAPAPQPIAVQDQRIRLTVQLRAATLLPPASQAQALTALHQVQTEADRGGLLELHLESALALAERSRNDHPQPYVHQAAAAVQQDATTHGYTALATRAATLAASHR